MDKATRWVSLAARIRTLWVLLAMIPVVIIVGFLAVALLVISIPVTLAGMLGWSWKNRNRRSITTASS